MDKQYAINEFKSALRIHEQIDNITIPANIVANTNNESLKSLYASLQNHITNLMHYYNINIVDDRKFNFLDIYINKAYKNDCTYEKIPEYIDDLAAFLEADK